MSASNAQLLRLLRLIPLASRDGGLILNEAADLCGVGEDQIRKDFMLLAERGFYLPAGRTDDFQILFLGERVRIHAPPAFHRPVRLGLDELLACALALRCAGIDSERRTALLRQVEEGLALQSDERGEGGEEPGVEGEEAEIVLRRASGDEIQAAVSRAIVHRRRLTFGYVKDGADVPEVRHVEPWRVVHAEGEAYVTGHDVERGEPRLFRIDRILGVKVRAEGSTAPVPDSLEEVRDDGTVRLLVGDRPEIWATVRYSPKIARWVRERFEGEDGVDGEYTVRHRLLSEQWLVRHVLGHAPDAQVVEPAEVRQAVADAVKG